jgi:error-prone DNA polymerase
MELSFRLQGHPRHLGIHVGGFVLTDAPITTLAPVEPARMDNRTILPWDKDDIDALALFKMDVLGLGMLTCIRKCFDLIHLTDGVRFTLATLPAEDKATYEALQRADSIGVFQVESRAQMAMLPRLKPQSFYDLVVEVAIIRPGPIQGGMVHPYLRRRNGEEKIEYPHESLRPILERTLGVPLFQEQVMKLAIVGAGYSGGEADQLRRDMAAWKKSGRLERHRQKLLDGFSARGVPLEFAERLYEQIKGFGEYGFPESHAASFAILVYASAYLKTHYPAHFPCALINSLPMGFYAPSQIIADAQEHGVTARPVDVNVSEWDCVLEPSGGAHPDIRLGLRLIKGLREDVGRAIADERRARGSFGDVNDLVRRCALDKKARAVLAKAGALDALTPHRRASVWAAMGSAPPLLRTLKEDLSGALPAPHASEVLLLDYESTGLSLTDHPMRHMRASVGVAADGRPVLDSRGVKETPHGTRALVCGLVIGRQRPGTADGTCFVTLEDEHGLVNVVVWGRDFEKWRKTVVTSTFLLVEGVVERQGIVVHVIAHGVRAVEPRMESAQLDLPFASRDFH